MKSSFSYIPSAGEMDGENQNILNAILWSIQAIHANMLARFQIQC